MIAIICLFILLAGNVDAQVVINGTVVNSKGALLPDVNIIPEGSMQTVTQKDGSFEITCPADSVSIDVTFSRIGYDTKSIKLYKGETDVQILLTDNTVNMDEVVVVAPKYSRFSNYAAQMI
ncbi:MAG: carboxypeptidase-like regulatory domain-containing protein, partial [Dysgonamonadaceae bacterium]|nr:carboxypeptidase-like regulatory domain-containing protein [Dysgonamonadaceae bacterium]